MILLQQSGRAEHLIMLFGVGLIGSAVVSNLSRCSDIKLFPHRWNWSGDNNQNISQLNKFIHEIGKASTISRLSTIWCAGQAGFGASDITQEIENFKQVLKWNKLLHSHHPNAQFSFHLSSSTGGLFENQQSINSNSIPRPMRPYGELKLAQEKLLLDSSWLQEKHIYRPTSVYGYPGPGQRMGLIPTLISNGIRNKVSTIYGHLHTLRDYVYTEDIGRIISKQVLAPLISEKTGVYFLGTARPASIFEIRQLIERRIQRKIYLQFRPDLSANTGSITLNPRALPTDWQALPLISGIAKVHRQLLGAQTAFETRSLVAHG